MVSNSNGLTRFCKMIRVVVYNVDDNRNTFDLERTKKIKKNKINMVCSCLVLRVSKDLDLLQNRYIGIITNPECPT